MSSANGCCTHQRSGAHPLVTPRPSPLLLFILVFFRLTAPSHCSHSVSLISLPVALIIGVWGMTSSRMLAAMSGGLQVAEENLVSLRQTHRPDQNAVN